MKPANETHADYHSRRGEFLTSHLLIEAHRDGVDGFRKALAEQRDDTQAYRFGRAAHVMILEGAQAFDAAYDIGGPVNPKTGKTYGWQTKRYQEWAATLESSREPIPPEDVVKIEIMSTKLKSIPAFQQLMAKGQAELSLRGEYRGLPTQCRLDWLSDYDGRKILVDLKTSGDIFGFENDIKRYGYHWQMAFYRSLIGIAGWENVPVYLVAIDKQPEPSGYVMRLSDETLDEAQRENESMIEQIRGVFLDFRNSILETRKCQSELSSTTSPTRPSKPTLNQHPTKQSSQA